MKYAQLLNYGWKLAEARKGKTYLFKVRAHRKDQKEISLLNNHVDQLAKQAAILDKKLTWNLPPQHEKIDAVNVAPPLRDTVDIVKVQNSDKEISTLLSQGQYKNYNIKRHEKGPIMAQEVLNGQDTGIPLLVMPTALRTDLIELAHAQGHFGLEKTLSRIKTVAW